MSGISSRTVFYDVINNRVRFWDWAEVKTALGVMGEPTPTVNWYNNPGSDVIDFDPDDQMVRIDRLERRSLHKQLFSNQSLVGGKMWPRKGP